MTATLPWSAILPFTGMCIFYSAEQLTLSLPTTSEQNIAIPVKGILREHGERSFEWSSNWTVKGTSSLSKRLILVGTEVSAWLVLSKYFSIQWGVRLATPKTLTLFFPQSERLAHQTTFIFVWAPELSWFYIVCASQIGEAKRLFLNELPSAENTWKSCLISHE